MPHTAQELEDYPWSDFLIVESNSFDRFPSRSPSVGSSSIDPEDYYPRFLEDAPAEPAKIIPMESIRLPVYYGEIENRTILVSNIHPDTTANEFYDFMQRFGETQTVAVDNLHAGAGSVKFYNLRDAHEFRAWGALGLKIRDRVWMVRFAPPKDAYERQASKPKVENTGTIVVFGLNPGTPTEDISSAFRSYGEIREIRKAPGKDRQCFIEFWDLRHAEAAVANTHQQMISRLGVRLSADFSIPGGFRKIAPKVLRDVVPSIERPDKKPAILSFRKDVANLSRTQNTVT
jgi:RNA recognition motif-containing protein